MNTHKILTDHYAQLVGLKRPWSVESVELKLEQGRVEICLAAKPGASWPCPKCSKRCKGYDHAPERQWRHLDTMQFETRFIARVPGCECPVHGGVTVAVKTVAMDMSGPYQAA